ncbi:AI-2E family transporter [Porphyromonas sp. COT-239 OH1446]|uniref:AI-2E family transporter n=1 Tax=Porphyromonas sp. COT-239 OH1446 TaxID=1515613 RepID=UPI00052BA86C|nr:AI-2E family transporter [Porphyromonas sp. COT-239 OH1446]KGN71396.1 permease [Porphyromonas sp. COT-239 OH1446]
MDKFLNKPFTLDRTVRILLISILVLLCVMAISAIWEVLLPFLLAGIFAYVMLPLVKFFQYKARVKSRGLSVLIVFVLLGVVLALGFIYLIPSIEEEIAKTLEALNVYNGGGLLELILPEGMLAMLKEAVDLDRFSQELSVENIMKTIETAWTQVGSIVDSTISVFSWGVVFAMGIVYFIFIMIDFEGLASGMIELFPPSIRGSLHSVMTEIDSYMNSYFRGQALIALSVGLLLSIGFNIIDLPMATAMGILIGLLNFIPYMQALGVIPLAFMSVLMSAQQGQGVFVCLLLAFGVLFIVQVIQETILVPKIMGEKMGMRPSLILLSLSVWGYLLGFFGMLVALPLTMSLYSIYMRYVLRDEAYIALIDAKLKRDRERREARKKAKK